MITTGNTEHTAQLLVEEILDHIQQEEAWVDVASNIEEYLEDYKASRGVGILAKRFGEIVKKTTRFSHLFYNLETKQFALGKPVSGQTTLVAELDLNDPRGKAPLEKKLSSLLDGDIDMDKFMHSLRVSAKTKFLNRTAKLSKADLSLNGVYYGRLVLAQLNDQEIEETFFRDFRGNQKDFIHKYDRVKQIVIRHFKTALNDSNTSEKYTALQVLEEVGDQELIDDAVTSILKYLTEHPDESIWSGDFYKYVNEAHKYLSDEEYDEFLIKRGTYVDPETLEEDAYYQLNHSQVPYLLHSKENIQRYSELTGFAGLVSMGLRELQYSRDPYDYVFIENEEEDMTTDSLLNYSSYYGSSYSLAKVVKSWNTENPITIVVDDPENFLRKLEAVVKFIEHWNVYNASTDVNSDNLPEFKNHTIKTSDFEKEFGIKTDIRAQDDLIALYKKNS